METLVKEQRIVWDSGFGYELGYLIGDADDKILNSYEVILTTGVCPGKTLKPKSEIKPYSEELAKQLSKQYICHVKTWAK